MVQPYNYSLGQSNPANAFIGGLRQGAAIDQFRVQREEQARQAQLQEQQMAQAQKLQERLNALAANPNPTVEDIMSVSALLPKDQADSLRSGFEQQQKSQQRATLRFGGQVLAALQTENPELAINMLRQRVTAENDRGNAQGAQFYQGMLNVVENDPQAARDSVGIMLGALPGGKEFIEAANKVKEESRNRQLFAAAKTEAEANAARAAVEANFAEIDAVANAIDAGLNPIALITDESIKPQVEQLLVKRKQLEQAEREENQLRIDKLRGEIAASEARIAENTENKVAQIQEAEAGLQLFGETAQQLIDLGDQSMGLANLGQTVGDRATGAIESRMMSVTPEVVQFDQLLETLKSQQFLNNVGLMRGLGALTEREGSRLENRIRSLDPALDWPILKNNLLTIQSTLANGLESLKSRYGNVQTQPEAPEEAAEGTADEQPPFKLIGTRPGQ